MLTGFGARFSACGHARNLAADSVLVCSERRISLPRACIRENRNKCPMAHYELDLPSIKS
jgi:hypothetical protein